MIGYGSNLGGSVFLFKLFFLMLGQSVEVTSGGISKMDRMSNYAVEKVIGNGSFGVVYHAVAKDTGDQVAIKKVFQDRRYKNREIQIMQELRHGNVVQLKHAFYTPGEKPDDLYLNVVMEYMSETVYRVIKSYMKAKQAVPSLIVKLYTFQLCRGLAYLHSLGICHRDIKPQNLLVSADAHILKICDFGSAKRLISGEPNVAYICSRYYRAPELILGATDYSCVVDTWSMGCVGGELLLGRPLFPGESGVDQLVEIIKVLGTPSKDQLLSMVPSLTEFNFPQVRSTSLSKVFKGVKAADELAVQFFSDVLRYEPKARIELLDALAHPYFDELRTPNLQLPNNSNSKPPLNTQAFLFDFTHEESQLIGPLRLQRILPKVL